MNNHSVEAAPPAACPECGGTQIDRFCAECGEQRPGHHDLSIGHLLGHLFHEIFHLDTQILRTMRALLLQPGFLTAEYFAGRKKRYVPPFRLFLTIFAVSLLIYTIFPHVAIWDISRMAEADKTGQFVRTLQRAAAKRQTSYTDMITEINHTWQHWLTILEFLIPFLLALPLQVLYLRRRRYFVEHFMFALHLQAFSQTLAILMFPAWYFRGFSYVTVDRPLIVITMSLTVVYTLLAVKNFYAQSTARSVIKGLVVVGAAYVSNVIVTILALMIALILVLRHKEPPSGHHAPASRPVITAPAVK